MLGDFSNCGTALGLMKPGDTCTLPDGSNIAIWNGAQLTSPSGGSIDAQNGAAVVAAGWPASQVAGQGTPWFLIGAVVVGGVGVLLLLSTLLGSKKATALP
jgi:hypothetical protein